MARTQRRRTASEMRPLVEAWRRGEGTQAEIASRHGMPTPTFAWWCAKLGREAGVSGFVAVDVRAPVRGSGEGFEVEIGGRLLRVPAGFDESDLRRLLSVLGASC
jgi:hypothetical protein